jgi:hypothetical protein
MGNNIKMGLREMEWEVVEWLNVAQGRNSNKP